MHDYKFRQSELSFGRRKRTWRRTLLLAAGLVLVAGALYGVVHLGSRWQENSEVTEASSNIIRLPLPPPTESE